MVEFLEVAEFVDDYVINKGRWEEEELVVKVEVAALGTGAPAGFVLFYKDFAQGEVIESVVVRDARVHKSTSMLFMV